GGPVDPLLRHQPPAVPAPPPEHQVAEAGMVPSRGPEAAAPVPTAAHRLDPLAVDLHVGITIPVPHPGVRHADAIRNRLLEYLGQRPPEQAEQGKREPVDPDIVVLPDGPGLLELALVSQPAVSDVRLLPEGALPLADLPQMHVPGDPPVMRAVEAAVLDQLALRGAQVLEQTPVVGQPRDGGEVALGDAEGHVHPPGVAPLRHDVAVADD